MPCSVNSDQHGHNYTIAGAEIVKTPGGHVRPACPAIDVWWSRSSKAKSEETLVIRQEYPDRATAEVLEMTFGQVYDLIDALNRAVEST